MEAAGPEGVGDYCVVSLPLLLCWLMAAPPAVGEFSSPTPSGLGGAASAKALSSPATTQQLIIHPSSCWETVPVAAVFSSLMLVILPLKALVL